MLKAPELQIPLRLFFLFSLIFLALINIIQFPVITLLKPLPILCLMAIVFFSSLASKQKKLLITALLFSVLGDIALTLPIQKQLELGLACFLMAHLVYIRLFTSAIHLGSLKSAQAIVKLSLSFAILLVSGLMLYILAPYLGDMMLPVVVYMIVIALMALCALQLNTYVALGAMLFMVSDSLIAFNEFLFKEGNYFFWIMLTYYLAQLFIVMGSIKYFLKRTEIIGTYPQ